MKAQLRNRFFVLEPAQDSPPKRTNPIGVEHSSYEGFIIPHSEGPPLGHPAFTTIPSSLFIFLQPLVALVRTSGTPLLIIEGPQGPLPAARGTLNDRRARRQVAVLTSNFDGSPLLIFTSNQQSP